MTKYMLLLVFFLYGCFTMTPEEQLAKASLAIESKDYNAAEVLLKSAIAEEPNNSILRIKLGTVYLRQGAILSAEKELLKAERLGSKPDEYINLMMEIFYLGGEFERLDKLWNEKSESLNEEQKQKASLFFAMALLAQGKKQKASSILSIASFPDGTFDAALANALALFFHNDKKAFDEVSRQLKNDYPNEWLALLIYANFKESQGDYKVAAKVYTDLYNLQPKDPNRLLRIALNYSRANELQSTKPYVDAILKQFPNQPLANQLKAQLMITKKDYTSAALHAEKAIQFGADSKASRALAGLAYYGLGEYERVYNNLSKIEDTLSTNDPLKRLFIAVSIKLGYGESAYQDLINDEQIDSLASPLVSKVAGQLFQQGDVPKALNLLRRVDTNQVTDEISLRDIGFLKELMGDSSGLDDIERALDSEGSSLQRYQTVTALLFNKKYDAAEKLVKEWLSKDSSSAEFLLLSAEVEKARGNTENAVNIYNQILKIDENQQSALNYLGKIDLEQGRTEAAIAKFNKSLKSGMINPFSIVGYYLASKRAGKSEQAVKKIEDILSKQGKNSINLAALARVYYLDGRYKDTLDLYVTIGLPSLGFGEAILLGDSSVKLGNFKKASEYYNQALSVDKQNPTAFYRKIALLEHQKDYKAAADFILKFRGDVGDADMLRLMEANFRLYINGADEALTLLSGIKDEGYNAEISAIKGRAFFNLKRYNESLEFIKADFQRAPNAENALVYYQDLMNLDRPREAMAILDNYLQQQPDDQIVRTIYANNLIVQKNLAEAKIQFEILVKQDKTNIIAMNNLAYILYLEKDYQQAKLYAELAINVAPDNKDVLKTLKQINEKLDSVN